MNYKLFIQNSPDGNVYDLSEIACQTTVTQSIDGTAGSLRTVFEKDPNQILGFKQGTLSNGSWIWLIVDDKPFFYGRIFRVGTDMGGTYQVTAYDNLRYLKNNDFAFYSGMTSSDIFADICKKYNLKYEIKSPTKYIPSLYNYENQTLFSIIKRGMDLASINDKKIYFIVDNFGTLTWSSFDAEKTNVQLGDESLVFSYTYEKSIDEDTYNKIKLYKSDENSSKVQSWSVEDTDSQKRWGILQLLKQVDDKMNESQIRENAENLLKVKNRETETLKLEGDGIVELVAGRGIKVVIQDQNIDKWLWIKSSSHTFTKYNHTMDLEVEI